MGKDREPRALYAREVVAARVFASRQLPGVMVSFATMSAMKMRAREDFWLVRQRSATLSSLQLRRHPQDHDSVFRSPPALQADSLVLSRLVRRDRCDVFRRSAHAVDLLCRLERRDWYRSEPRHASILAAAGWLGDVQAVLDSLLCVELFGFDQRQGFHSCISA